MFASPIQAAFLRRNPRTEFGSEAKSTRDEGRLCCECETGQGRFRETVLKNRAEVFAIYEGVVATGRETKRDWGFLRD